MEAALIEVKHGERQEQREPLRISWAEEKVSGGKQLVKMLEYQLCGKIKLIPRPGRRAKWAWIYILFHTKALKPAHTQTNMHMF